MQVLHPACKVNSCGLSMDRPKGVCKFSLFGDAISPKSYFFTIKLTCMNQNHNRENAALLLFFSVLLAAAIMYITDKMNLFMYIYDKYAKTIKQIFTKVYDNPLDKITNIGITTFIIVFLVFWLHNFIKDVFNGLKRLMGDNDEIY